MSVAGPGASSQPEILLALDVGATKTIVAAVDGMPQHRLLEGQ